MPVNKDYANVTKLLVSIGKEVKAKYKDDLKSNKKFASGKLYNSINYRIEYTSKGIKLYFVAEKYWINIEEGRVAGAKMPPVALIQRWMQIKNIQPKKGQTKSGVAFAIARNISIKGIKKKPFLKQIKKDISQYVDDIKIALSKDIEVDVKLIINKIHNIQGNKYIQIKK